MSISTYENTPLVDYSNAPYTLPQLSAPSSLSGDYYTHQAWPPIMKGTLRTQESIQPETVNGSLSYELKCRPSKADVVIVGNNYTLTPRVGQNGPDVFTYTVTQMRWDATNNKNVRVEGTTEETNQVTLTILPVNQPPQATTDANYAVVISSTLDNVKLAPATGTDADGHKVTFTLTTVPQYGTFRFVSGDNETATGDSSFVYTSGASAGTETLEYEVDDCESGDGLVALDDQGAAWNRLNCMKGLNRGRITISVTSSDALPDVEAGLLTLLEDQSNDVKGLLTRNPSPDPAVDPYLRFVMRIAPELGAVDFQCKWEVAQPANSSATHVNWTEMKAGQYCENVVGSNGTNSQVYRFRPKLNVNGADFFSFGLQGIDTMSSRAPPSNKEVKVTIVPTNDAPTIPQNRTIVKGHYVYRAGESPWKDPTLVNATDPPTFTTLSLSVVSIDGERTMLANVTNPERGKLYTNLTADGSNVNVTTEYNVSKLLNMTLDAAASTNATTIFNLTMYYVPPLGYMGSPVATVNWHAWDATMTKSITGKVLIQVLCPLGYSKNGTASTAANVYHGVCAPCAAGTYAQVEDMTRCTSTDAGYFSNAASGAQTACPIGTYSSVKGSAACTSCPANRPGGDVNKTSTTAGAASSSVKDCVCTAADVTSAFPQGYYGRPGEACYYCETNDGWKCTENNLSMPMPDFGYWIDVCKPYPAKKRECFPQRACEPIVKTNISAMFQTNENVSATTACAALPVPDVVDGTCAVGYGSEACSSCIRPGYYRLEGGCRKCPESDPGGMIAFMVIAVVVAGPLLFKLSEQMKNFPSINIGISFMQYLGLFSIQISYPEPVRRVLSAFSFFNLNLELIHPECSLDSWDFSKKWQVMSLMPIFVFCVLAVGVAIAGALCAYNHFVGEKILEANPGFLILGKGKKANAVYKLRRMLVLGMSWNQFVLFARKAIRALLTFFQVAYVFLAGSAFELFDCNKNDADGLYYLNSEPSVRCGWPHGPNDTATKKWVDIYQLAIVTIVMYPVGIFLLFATLLYMIRHSLDSDGARTVLGFLYHRYEKQWYWYELVQLVKKVTLVGILALMPDGDTSLQSRKTCCSIALVTLVTLMHFYAAPYESSNLDNMMSMALGAEFLLLFSGLIFMTDKISNEFRLALTIINIIVVIFAVIFLTMFIVVDVMPGVLVKIKKFWSDRKNAKERKERKKKVAAEKKARKARGEKENKLSLYAQIKIFSFIKRALVSAQAAKFFNPHATDAVATIRTAWGQKRVKELTKEGELDQPNVTKEDIKSMFNRLQDRAKKVESFSIMDAPDPTFADFLKDTSKSDVLEGMALEDLTENHEADFFFEKLMCDMLPIQQKAEEEMHWFWKTVKNTFQGRSTWKRKRHAVEKLKTMESSGLLTLSKTDLSSFASDPDRSLEEKKEDSSFSTVDPARMSPFSFSDDSNAGDNEELSPPRPPGTVSDVNETTVVETVEASFNEDNDSASARKDAQENDEA